MGTLYMVYQGRVYELPYEVKNDKYIISHSECPKRSVTRDTINIIHSKKHNAYIIGFDLDKIIDTYKKYIRGQITTNKESINEYMSYLARV